MPKKENNSTSKVDYRLLYKKQISDYLESIDVDNLTVKEANTIMDNLFKMGDQVIPVCIEKLKDDNEELAPVLCYVLQYAEDPSVVEPLIDILLSKGMSDEIKARILGVIAEYGVDINQLPLNSILTDLDRMAANSMEKLLSDISDDIFFMTYILEDFEDFSEDMQIAYLYDLGGTNDERAVGLLEVLARLSNPVIALESVKQIGRIKHPRALDSLIRLEKENTEENHLKATISREIRRLKMSGVIEQNFNYRIKCEHYKSIVSTMDGTGSRTVWFSWRHPYKKRRLCTVNILINVEEGIKDCWSISEIGVKDFNSTLMELKKSAEVIEDYEYGLTLLKDALMINKTKDYPVPFSFYFWDRFFEENDLSPEEYVVSCPDISKTSIIYEIENNDINESYRVLDYREFSDWFVSHPRVYDYAEKYMGIEKKYGGRKSGLKRLKKLNNEFIKEFIIPDKKKLKRMLELSWDFLLLNDSQDKADMVFKVLNTFDNVSLFENPFIQRITIESIKIALNNLKKGLDLRVNPDGLY